MFFTNLWPLLLFPGGSMGYCSNYLSQEIRSQDSKMVWRLDSWASLHLKLWRGILRGYWYCYFVLESPSFGDDFALLFWCLCTKGQDHILCMGHILPLHVINIVIASLSIICEYGGRAGSQGISIAATSTGPCHMRQAWGQAEKCPGEDPSPDPRAVILCL